MSRIRKIHLDAGKIINQKSAAQYMTDLFHFPGGFVQNLSTLGDCLEEVSDDTDILLSQECVKESCENAYAFKVLMTIGKAAERNKHLQIHFTE